MKEQYRIFDQRETLKEKIYSNFVTYSMLASCAWVSQDSTWWTFATGCLFMASIFTRIAGVMKERTHILYSKEELQEWVDTI